MGRLSINRRRINKVLLLFILFNLAITATLATIIILALNRVSLLIFKGNGIEATNEHVPLKVEDVGLICIAASISIAASCIASGIALKGVATAGFAAATERPELRTYLLILAGLAEGIAIYGLLIAIMILSKV